LPIAFQGEADGVRHSHWMIALTVTDAIKRDRLREWLEARDIETRPVFYPIHSMPMYARACEVFPVAEDIASRGINVPSWPGLADAEIDFICQAIREFISYND